MFELQGKVTDLSAGPSIGSFVGGGGDKLSRCDSELTTSTTTSASLISSVNSKDTYVEVRTPSDVKWSAPLTAREEDMLSNVDLMRQRMASERLDVVEFYR